MEVSTKLFSIGSDQLPFALEKGGRLEQVDVAYETYGKLNAKGTNAILICHALTGDAHAAGIAQMDQELQRTVPFFSGISDAAPGWWNQLIGPGKTFDSDNFFIISSNILGSCYGSTGPASVNPATQKPYAADFPLITVRDMVRAQFELLKHLRIQQLVTVSGGSLGGMQALEWAVLYPEMVKSIIPIATAAQHSAWAIGFNHLARQAVLNDPAFLNGNYKKQPVQGLSLARKIGMVSYRTMASFDARFSRTTEKNVLNFRDNDYFQVDSYLNYQGQKLVKRFDANSFMTITRALDLHDLSEGRTHLKSVLANIPAKTLCIGIDSDLLYPAAEQQAYCKYIPNSTYAELKSVHGHDAFLIEFDQLHEMITPFLETVSD